MNDSPNTRRLIYRSLGIPASIPDERAAALAPLALLGRSALDENVKEDVYSDSGYIAVLQEIIDKCVTVIETGDADKFIAGLTESRDPVKRVVALLSHDVGIAFRSSGADNLVSVLLQSVADWARAHPLDVP